MEKEKVQFKKLSTISAEYCATFIYTFKFRYSWNYQVNFFHSRAQTYLNSTVYPNINRILSKLISINLLKLFSQRDGSSFARFIEF